MTSANPKSSHVATNHFLTNGEQYAARRPTYSLALAKVLATLCGRTEHVLDVGCGTGQLSLLLAEVFDTVTATDPSEAQIANVARHKSITYRRERAEKTSLANESVDLLTAAQAAHWFDLDTFYSEARRVLKPGGVLALVSYGVPELGGPARELLHKFYWQDIYRFWPTGRKHVEQGYRTLEFPFDEVAIPDLRIERTWDLEEFLGYVETWSAIGKARDAGAADVYERFKDELTSQWGRSSSKYLVTWPIAGRVTKTADG